MKVPGARLRLWKSPDHFMRRSMSSRSRSSHLVFPSLISWPSSETSCQLLLPHFAAFIFSTLLAFFSNTWACVYQFACMHEQSAAEACEWPSSPGALKEFRLLVCMLMHAAYKCLMQAELLALGLHVCSAGSHPGFIGKET